MKSNKHIYLLVILIALVTLFIFSNSLKNSEQSNKDSYLIEVFVEPIVEAVFVDADVNVTYIVRKGAHLTEFCLLGITVMCTVFYSLKHYRIHIMGYGFFYVLAVAVADEFIQSFSDRTSSVKDVLIDFTGAVIGFAVVTSIRMAIKNPGKEKRKQLWL